MMTLEYARETPEGFSFPSSVPDKRGRKKEIAIMIIVCGIFLGICLSVTTLMCSSTEIFLRCCALFEEYGHIESRYGSFKQMLFDVYNFTKFFYFITIVSVLFLITAYIFTKQYTIEIIFRRHYFVWFFIPMSFYKVLMNFNFHTSPVNTSYNISNSEGLDYGSGLAHSFFHGYLKIILPNFGLQNNKGGLLEFQQDYQDRHGIKFAAHKLFILIPCSQYCPPQLENSFSPSVSASKELEGIELDRAGISRRSYKNSVYKIKSRSNKLYYVTAEYATPIKTLDEAMRQNTPRANIYKQHCKEIIQNFYTTLIGLLKDAPDCRDLCDVIYYNDIDDQTGRFHDVGRIILKRLEDLRQDM